MEERNNLDLRWKGKQRRIGITGGIASGKTLIGNFLFQAKQWPIVDADLYAPETRTSSPVRIPRNKNFHHPDFFSLYPCGEGAGYAGGIMSAAIDGEKCAEKC